MMYKSAKTITIIVDTAETFFRKCSSAQFRDNYVLIQLKYQTIAVVPPCNLCQHVNPQ